jgi:hypothetical protein
MVDHFHDHMLSQGKLGGEAQAMVVTNGIERSSSTTTPSAPVAALPRIAGDPHPSLRTRVTTDRGVGMTDRRLAARKTLEFRTYAKFC